MRIHGIPTPRSQGQTNFDDLSLNVHILMTTVWFTIRVKRPSAD